MTNKFENALKSTLNNETSYTDNGAAAFSTSGKKLLDLNFATSSLRNADEGKIVSMFSAAFYENPFYAIKWMFFARDVRGGMGERRLFRACLKWLLATKPELTGKLAPLVAEYGRFDDLLVLAADSNVWPEIVKFIDKQISADYENFQAGKTFSLLAKWLPSVNTSSPKTRALARKLCAELDLSERQYRKMLSALRAQLKVVEVAASANDWSEINYNAVPSMANLKYKNAFLKHDETRRRQWLADLEKPESGAKINSSVAFPSDIVHSYMQRTGYNYSWNRAFSKDETLEAMWKALPDYVAGCKDGSCIVVADGSGSMMSRVSNSGMTALEVANALAIYFSERLSGPYKNKYITFSSKPQYVDFSNASALCEKLGIALEHDECANTNIEATFDLILNTAVSNGLKQEDLPSNVLIVSDMQFDSATTTAQYCWRNGSEYDAKQSALFMGIARKFEAHGYSLPKIVFWNVASGSRTDTIPLQQNKFGVILVSGYSAAIAKMVFSAQLDPYLALIDTLNAERYNAVGDAIKGLV